jgi:hypothetical protein
MLNPWDNWNDYLAGLYENRPVEIEKVSQSVQLLSNPDEFFEVALEMVREWDKAATQNLVNLATGQQAWIGQASCCYAHGATSEETRLAWGQLSNTIQDKANSIANAVIEGFVRGRNHAQTLFGY